MNRITIKNRIPKDFFITSGSGSSDVDRHTGSYHLCLHDAGIDNCNIIVYSSILPAISNKMDKPLSITHGEVAECIIAEANGGKGVVISCGIIYGTLYDKETGVKYGGLVCERNGCYTEEKINSQLHESLDELYKNGYMDKYEMRDVEIHTKSMHGTKMYNTVMVCLVFQTYEVEIDGGTF